MDGKGFGCVIAALFGAFLIGAAILYFGNWFGVSREEQRTAEVLKELQVERQKREAAEKQVTELTADNERLRVQLKEGLDLGEERKALATRTAEVERREELLKSETATLAGQKEEFFARVKTTEKEYGEAIHARQEYDRMRAERDAAQASKGNWLEVFFGVLVIAALLFVGLVFVWSRWRHERHRRENELRHQLDVVRTMVGNALPPAQAGQLLGAVIQSLDSWTSP